MLFVVAGKLIQIHERVYARTYVIYTRDKEQSVSFKATIKPLNLSGFRPACRGIGVQEVISTENKEMKAGKAAQHTHRHTDAHAHTLNGF